MEPTGERWNGIPADRVRAAMERILASRPFQQSETLTRFLRFTVEHELEKPGEVLREYTLGTEVFGLGAKFDPRLDSMVRVEADKLRSRLAAYYAVQGRDEKVRIVLPKGSYTPVFRPAPATRRPPRVRQLLRQAAWAALAVCACGMAALAGIRVLYLESATPSVAVLPFTNLSSDRGADYWSDGVTEEITDVLARIPGLRVVARASAFRFAGVRTEVREAGHVLGVGTVLEGTVRRTGGRLRIAAQLFNTEDGYLLWSASYDREERDAPGIEADIAEAIARNLELHLPEDPRGRQPERRLKNAAAHDLVLQARYMAADSPDRDARMKCYRRAIDADSGCATAYAGIADEWVKRSLEGWVAPRDAMESARDAVAEALLFDDRLAHAHLLSAMVKWTYEWDWAGARREFERTLELNPNDASARMQYARYLAMMGDRQGATTQLEQVRALDPISPAAIGAEAAVYYLLRDYDRTIQHAQEVLAAQPEMGPIYYWLGRAYDSKGQSREACGALEKWRNMPGGTQPAAFGMLGSVYARSGRRYDALRLLGEAITRAKQGHVSPSGMALLYAGLGERKRAIEWLDKAYQQRDHALVGIKADPAFDPLREDAGFQSLIGKMKLN